MLALREQLNAAQQADGYTWAPVDAPLMPILATLRALAAAVLLPESAVTALQDKFKMGFQTTVSLWRRLLTTEGMNNTGDSPSSSVIF